MKTQLSAPMALPSSLSSRSVSLLREAIMAGCVCLKYKCSMPVGMVRKLSPWVLIIQPMDLWLSNRYLQFLLFYAG